MELRSNLFLIRTTPSSLHDSGEILKRYEAKKGMLQPEILRNKEGSGKYTEKEVDSDIYHLQPKREKDLYREDKQVM